MTTYRTGLVAEALCRLLLSLKFYRILASRWRSPLGEIDIVAARGDVLAIIEVKARASQREALDAVTPRQRQRLQRAAMDFLARHPRFVRCVVRFDVMLVVPRRWPRHIMNAWQPDS